MSKGPALIVIFAVCLIALFLVMLYLMSSVNPPPLARIDVPDLGIDSHDGERGKDLEHEEKVEQGHKIGNIFLTDPTTEFMLDKIEAEEIDFYQSTRRRSKYDNEKYNGTGVFRYLHRKAVPPLWPRARHTIVVDPTMHIVMPPNWPTTQDRFEATPRRRAKQSTGVFLHYRDDSDIRKAKTRTNITVLSPMKRRSINNVRLLNNTGSVILKILNGKGNSMIEIKVGSENNIRKKKSKESQNSSGEESDLTLQLENNGERQSSKIVKDTIMTIMANDSIVIDEFDTKSILESAMPDIRNITDLISLMLLVSSKDRNNTNAITRNQRSEINETVKVPWYENSTLHDAKSNNKSRSFRRDLESNRNMTDSKNIAALTYTNGNKVAKNSSNLQTIARIESSWNTTASNTLTTHTREYDKKFNKTEFMNMLFEDEVRNDTTIDVSNLSISKNHTILLNDAVPSNYTEFSETSNDSEITIY